MSNVKHTVKWQYGSYSGTTTVLCDENDDLDVVEAKVRREESLSFLAMCSESYKIIDTQRLDDDY